MPDARPRRTALYLPAIRASAVARARTVDADCIILDLEDAVAPEQKPAARAAAVDALALDWGHRELLVRVNGIKTEWADEDFAALTGRVAALVVPKVDSAAEAARAVASAGGTPVWAMIETPRAIIEAPAIAATAGVTALIAGFADLAKDLRLRPGPDRAPLHYAMGAIVVAARAAGILAFDGVFTDLNDPDGLVAEAEQARSFGFDGKTLIHPAQVEPVNAVFAPSADEIEDARGLIAAHAAAAAEAKGVTTWRGKLVEVLHVAEAERLLASAAALSARR